MQRQKHEEKSSCCLPEGTLVQGKMSGRLPKTHTKKGYSMRTVTERLKKDYSGDYGFSELMPLSAMKASPTHSLWAR
jgi:hypothetical protein